MNQYEIVGYINGVLEKVVVEAPHMLAAELTFKKSTDLTTLLTIRALPTQSDNLIQVDFITKRRLR